MATAVAYGSLRVPGGVQQLCGVADAPMPTGADADDLKQRMGQYFPPAASERPARFVMFLGPGWPGSAC